MTRRTALITGASRGVGRAIAVTLSRNDYRVMLVAREKDSLIRVQAELAGDGHDIFACDLGTQEGVHAVATKVEQWSASGLNVFVHCAAATPDPEGEAELGSTDPDTLEQHVHVTALSGVRLLALLKSSLQAGAPSNAVLISSDWTIDGVLGPPVFSASKAFCADVWKHARKEYLRNGTGLSVLIAGNIASFDLDWETPKWSVDDPISSVTDELGHSRVSLLDVAETVHFIVTRKLGLVEEVRLSPRDADYTP